MTTVTAVLGIVPGLQATSLVAHNLKLIPKNFGMKKNGKMNMKKSVKKFTGAAVGTMVGVGLMKPTAQMINSL